MDHPTGFRRDLPSLTAAVDDCRPEGQGDARDEINHGGLSSNLDTVVDEGPVESGELDRRTYYSTRRSTGDRETTGADRPVRREIISRKYLRNNMVSENDV